MPGPSAGDTAVPSQRYSYYALAVVIFANFLNYLDRFVASGLEHSIRNTIEMKSSTWGWVYTSFTLGYLVASPFVGEFSDRYSRPRIFSVCIAIWSLATIGCGFASSALDLILCRIFVGVGEAGCLAIGPALVSDYFDPKFRGRAMSAFFAALPLGAIAGFAVAGFAEGKLHDWRPAFFAGGIPGLVLMVVLYRLIDPPRGAHEGLDPHQPQKIQTLKDYGALLKNRTLLYIMVAQAFSSFALIPLVHYGKNYFLSNGWEQWQITLALGLGMVAGIFGSIGSGWMGDRLAKRHPGAYSGVAAVGFLAGLPMLWLALLMPEHKWLCGPALVVTFMLYFACMPAVNAQISTVTLPTQRSMAYAMAVFVLHILGDTVSPPLFGAVSDWHSREFAFKLFPLTLIGSGVLCILAYRSAAKDIEHVRQMEGLGPLDSSSPPH
jgi:MFS family permease